MGQWASPGGQERADDGDRDGCDDERDDERMGRDRSIIAAAGRVERYTPRPRPMISFMISVVPP